MDAVSCRGYRDRVEILTAATAHIKALLQVARGPATDGYTRIVQSLQKEGNVGPRTHKSAAGVETTTQATYLCLQCHNVNNSRERHRKDHAFGKPHHPDQ